MDKMKNGLCPKLVRDCFTTQNSSITCDSQTLSVPRLVTVTYENTAAEPRSHVNSGPGYQPKKTSTLQTLTEFILETENRLGRENRPQAKSSSDMNPVSLPSQIYPSIFPSKPTGK